MEINHLELPVEIWTMIFGLNYNTKTLCAAMFVCRDFYNILYHRVFNLRNIYEVAVINPPDYFSTYMKPYYKNKIDRGSKFGEDYVNTESGLFILNEKQFILNTQNERYLYPLSLHFDVCVVFTQEASPYLPEKWKLSGYDRLMPFEHSSMCMIRGCILRNAPIIVAIQMRKDELMPEQTFNERVLKMKKYIKDVDAPCDITVIPYILDIAPEEQQFYLPWYTGPDLLTALTNISKTTGKSHKQSKFLINKRISETRCLGTLRHGSLKVNDQVDTLSGKKTVKSITLTGENIGMALTGQEVEIELGEVSDRPNPDSLNKLGLIGLGVKPIKTIHAKVFINRGNRSQKSMRNGFITWIHFLGGKAKCKVEFVKMLELSKRQYLKSAEMGEKYHWDKYGFIRNTLDPDTLSLVNITPCDKQLTFVMTLAESPDLSRFYIAENKRWIGQGVVLQKEF